MSLSSVDIEISTRFSASTFLGRERNAETNRLVRDRSYSDAHCLLEKAKSDETAAKLFPLPEADHDAAVKEGTDRSKHAHHGNNRPRSKSESEFRPSLHKKKHATYKQSTGHHSPHHGPRPLSPKNLTHPTSCGKMWIRPVPIRSQAARSSPYARHIDHTHCVSPCLPIQPHFRQVSQESSASPADDVEMDISIPMLYSSPNSSFDTYHKPKAVVAFGESGKPIKPIAMFRHESPTDARAAQSFQWQH
ncbi:hypothetical protein ACHAWX_006954 [Stephanocyclus meneghinianus]